MEVKNEKLTKNRFYDKRLILQIVKEVEMGVPRRDINEKYQLGASTLDGWLKRYGSEEYFKLKRISISALEKRKIVAQIEQGILTKDDAMKFYNIKCVSAINGWIRKTKNEVCSLPTEKQKDMTKKTAVTVIDNIDDSSIKQALKDAQLKIEALNTMIDLAESQFKIKIRKKFGTKQ